jgi:hypothetical protein
MNTNMIFSTSFTMNGYLIGCSSNGATWNGTVYTCGSSRTLFSQSFTGSGIATTSARAIDDPSGRTLWLSRGADNFTFSPASPSPTPEPATVLLVGMGLAAGARSTLRFSSHDASVYHAEAEFARVVVGARLHVCRGRVRPRQDEMFVLMLALPLRAAAEARSLLELRR